MIKTAIRCQSGMVMVFDRNGEQLLEKVWGWEYTDDVDYVCIYISHLRQKIEPDPSLPKYIITEPGVGYYFQKPG